MIDEPDSLDVALERLKQACFASSRVSQLNGHQASAAPPLGFAPVPGVEPPVNALPVTTVSRDVAIANPLRLTSRAKESGLDGDDAPIGSATNGAHREFQSLRTGPEKQPQTSGAHDGSGLLNHLVGAAAATVFSWLGLRAKRGSS